MSVFSHVMTISGTPHSTYVSTLEIAWINGTPFLFTGSAANGGMASYQVTSTGVSFVDQIGAGANRGTYGLSDIDLVEVGGTLVLVPSGRVDDRMAFHSIDSLGNFDGVSILGASSDLIGNIEHSVSMVVQGKTFLVSSQWGNSGFQAYRVRDDLSLEHKKTWEDSPTTYAGDIQAMTSAVVAGRTYFFVASGQDTGVSSYWMGQWGNVKERGSVGVEDGLWVSAPTALVAAEVGGKAYLILGAAGSNSITVIRVNDWGGLFIESHYTDTLDTRFGNVQAMDTFTIGNRSFIVAGGGDDGVALFELNPGGTLTHIESIADGNDTTLMDITAIEAAVVQGQVILFVTGSDNGITQLSVSLGNIGNSQTGTDNNDVLSGAGKDDLLMGRDGDDTLYGNGGADRLIDGAGVDTLFGGNGADRFVFVDDNRLDTIGDFEIWRDVIDLGSFAMLYSFDQLSFVQRDYGVLLTIGDDRFRIMSENGQLLISDLTEDNFDFGL